MVTRLVSSYPVAIMHCSCGQHSGFGYKYRLTPQKKCAKVCANWIKVKYRGTPITHFMLTFVCLYKLLKTNR